MFRFAIVVIALLPVLSAFAREVVIISDLDETLRQANVEHHLKAAGKLIKGVRPYVASQIIFTELKAKNPESSFYYLSNSYDFLYDGQKWTKKNGFPVGTVYQRHLKDKSDTFKISKLKEIAKKHPNADEWILFGDNIERDPEFYQKFIAQSGIKNATVFIRDARLIFPIDASMVYYQHEAQILDLLSIGSVSTAIIKQLPFNHLIPPFLMKNLYKRLVKECKLPKPVCKEEADEILADVRFKLEIRD